VFDLVRFGVVAVSLEINPFLYTRLAEQVMASSHALLKAQAL